MLLYAGIQSALRESNANAVPFFLRHGYRIASRGRRMATAVLKKAQYANMRI